MRLAKLRSLDEFLGKSARFQLPDTRQHERWSNRVEQNLLYYQTNYILVTGVTFLIFAVADPVGVACGLLVTAITIFLACLFNGKRRDELRQAFQARPVIACAIGLVGLAVMLYCLRSALTFLLAVLVPVLLCLVHASLRLRNTSSKISNQIRGLKSSPDNVTPMQVLFGWLALVSDAEGLDL